MARKFTSKSDMVPPVPIQKWEPKPDMGEIKPKAPAEKECTCLHFGKTHYGPEGKTWCNVGGCNCQKFNEKA